MGSAGQVCGITLSDLWRPGLSAPALHSGLAVVE